MSLFLSGLALTAAGPAMVAYGRRRGETDEVNSRLLSLGYSCAIFGPFLLLVYVATLPSALLVAAAVSGLLWGADWLAKRTRGRRWTSGAARYGSDAFLMVLGVCVVRFFVVEPFVVPSSSMRPTLSVGDVIIVDKFSYGIRLPVLNLPLIPTGQPARGQMIVFEYPPDRSRAFVKRVIGIPGDTVRVDDSGIEINVKGFLRPPPAATPTRAMLAIPWRPTSSSSGSDRRATSHSTGPEPLGRIWPPSRRCTPRMVAPSAERECSASCPQGTIS